MRVRAEVARARRDLIAAESLARQETVLADYLSPETVGESVFAGRRLVPADAFPDVAPEGAPDVTVLAAAALGSRPDVALARLQIENTELALTGSRNARLPALDLVVSARSNALAGEVNPLLLADGTGRAPDPEVVGGYGTALSQLWGRRFPDYGVGLQLTIPVGNGAARADHARDQVALSQQQPRLKQVEKQVHVEIRNALTALEQARASLEVARLEREYQEEAVAAEEQRFTVGATTTFMVIQYQRDLAQARAAEVAARGIYLKARMALDRASGRLLETYAVEVEPSDERRH